MAYTLTKWNLGELYPGFDSPDLQMAFDNVEEQVMSFEGIRGKLLPDIDSNQFMEFVRASEQTARIINKIYAFTGLSFAADTQDQVAQTYMARVQQFAAEMQNRTLFFSLWWKELDDRNAERLMSSAGDYRYYLEEIRHFKPHTLSEAEEKIINIKDVTGAGALITLYDAITNRYVFKLDVDGETKELTRGQLMAYVQGPDAGSASQGLPGAVPRLWRRWSTSWGRCTRSRARDWHNENIGLRKFSSPMSVRNLQNDIPDEAVDALLDVARKNTKIFQRYFRLKAKQLGVQNASPL